MKPRTGTELGHPKGFTVRLSEEDIDIFKLLAKKEKQESTNQLLAQMCVQVMAMCQVPFALSDESLLVKLSPTSKKLWLRLANSDVRRTLPNKKTLPIRITFPETKRKDLRRLAQRLRWAEGQLILECLHAFCQLAAASEAIASLPDVIDLARGRSFFSGPEVTGEEAKDKTRDTAAVESINHVLKNLNIALGHIAGRQLESTDKPSYPLKTKLNLV